MRTLRGLTALTVGEKSLERHTLMRSTLFGHGLHATVVLTLLIGGTVLQARPAIGAAPAARVTVDAGVSRGVLPPTAFGMNTAVWDGHLLDAAVPTLLSDAGVTMLRFPGGSTADNYHWQNNSMTPGGGYVNPSSSSRSYLTEFWRFPKLRGRGRTPSQMIKERRHGTESVSDCGA